VKNATLRKLCSFLPLAWTFSTAGVASLETTQHQDNVGLVRQQALAGYTFTGNTWGNAGIQARWTQTLLKDPLGSFPAESYPSAGLTAHWDKIISSWSLRAEGGLTELKAQGWMGDVLAEYQATQHFKLKTEALSQLMDGSLFSREVRSTKLSPAVGYSFDEHQIWAEVGGSAEVRRGGRQPALAVIMNLPNNLLINEYFWIAKGLPFGTNIGLSAVHNTSKYDMTQVTSAATDPVLVYASYPYAAPLNEWVTAGILGIAHEWKIGVRHTFGGRLTGNIPIWSVTRIRWEDPTSAIVPYYYDADNLAKLRIEFLGYYSLTDSWYVSVPCAMESLPSKARSYFQSSAWNSYEAGLKIQHVI